METLNLIIVFVVALFGGFFSGYAVGWIAKEELKAGRKYFIWLKRMLLIAILFMFGLAPYGFILDIFQSVFEKLGLDPYPDSCSRKGRFSFLIIATLAASIYFPIFFYLVYTGSKYSLAVRMGVGFILSSFVVIFVASEWIGFFLSEIWRRSVENEIKTYLPMTREKTI